MQKTILILGAASDIASSFVETYQHEFQFIGLDVKPSLLQHMYLYYWLESACNPCFLYQIYQNLQDNHLLPDYILHFANLNIQQDNIHNVRIEHLMGQIQVAILPYILSKQIFPEAHNYLISTDADRLKEVFSYQLAKTIQHLIADPAELILLGSVQNTDTHQQFKAYADQIITQEQACTHIYKHLNYSK